MSWIVTVKNMLMQLPNEIADIIITDCVDHAALIIQKYAKNMLSLYSRVKRNERIAARFYESLHNHPEPVIILNNKWKWKFDLLVQITYAEKIQHARLIKCKNFPFKNNSNQFGYIYPSIKKNKRQLQNISYHKYFSTLLHQ